MTARTWISSATDSIDDPAAWSPNGAPTAGDTLTIAQGNPTISYETLQGLTIRLGGPAGQTGPSFMVIIHPETTPPDGFNLIHAPNPTMTFTYATIAADTAITVPTVPFRASRLHVPTPNVATIVMTQSVNNGTISTEAAGLLQRGGTLNLTMHTYGPSQFGDPALINNGKIVAAAGTKINLTGYYGLTGPTWPDIYGLPGHAKLVNNGVIDVTGTLDDNSVGIDGHGTINLNAAPGALGLASRPGSFLYSCHNASEISATQHFAFHGGHLLFGSGFALTTETVGLLGNFQGELDGFGGSASDMIELRGFTVDTSSFANGVLTMQSAAAGDFSLHFANLSPLGHFGFARNGINTDITWRPPQTA
jgi:hypothetical protein